MKLPPIEPMMIGASIAAVSAPSGEKALFRMRRCDAPQKNRPSVKFCGDYGAWLFDRSSRAFINSVKRKRPWRAALKEPRQLQQQNVTADWADDLDCQRQAGGI